MRESYLPFKYIFSVYVSGGGLLERGKGCLVEVRVSSE